MAVTIRSIAEDVGVSINTVSRAMNDKPDVSPETRSNVLKAAAKLRYRPNQIARGLAANETRTLGLIISDVANPFFSRLVRGAEDVAGQEGYGLMLCNTDEKYEKEVKAVHMVIEKRVDGAMVTPVQADSKDIQELRDAQIPFVLTNRYFEKMESDHVIVNNVKGAYLATSHLLKLGHTGIGHISGPSEISTVRERLEGYRRALEEHGLAFREELVVRTDLHLESGKEATRKLLGLKMRPTAIFAYSDLLAAGVMQAVEAEGLSIPGDIALVGYDNIDFSRLLGVPLTTVAQPSYEIGSRAAQILIKKIRSKDVRGYEHIVLEPELVIRASCGATYAQQKVA